MSGPGAIRLEAEPEPGEEVVVSGPALEALLLWSPRPGSAFTVVSPSGACFRARLINLGDKNATLVVFESMEEGAAPRLEVTLLQALPDKERMELIIEKATELGVDLIVPWQAERGVSLSERDSRQAKSRRWPERALRAAKQCRRSSIPSVAPFCSLEEALDYAIDAEVKIALWEKARTPLRLVLESADWPGSVALLVGPEGGLTDDEMIAAGKAGFIGASLGARVLRTETAAIAALAVVQHTLGGLE